MISKKIKDYITKNGIKQRYVAEQAGLSENKFSLMMRGKRQINAEEYLSICKALNVQPSFFSGVQ